MPANEPELPKYLPLESTQAWLSVLNGSGYVKKQLRRDKKIFKIL